MNGTKWTENNQSSPHFAGPPARANSAARNRVLAPQGGGREPKHLSARRLSASPASSLKREGGEGVSKGEGGGIVQNVTNSNTFATKSEKWTRGPCCPHLPFIYGSSMAHVWPVPPKSVQFFTVSERNWKIQFHCFWPVGESGRSHRASIRSRVAPIRSRTAPSESNCFILEWESIIGNRFPNRNIHSEMKCKLNV